VEDIRLGIEFRGVRRRAREEEVFAEDVVAGERDPLFDCEVLGCLGVCYPDIGDAVLQVLD
jgi:hypothetical protein